MLTRAAAAVAVLLVAGCGGGGSAGEGDPARLVPADAALYVETLVRPEGSEREDALAAARKVLGTDDPAGRIRDLVERAITSAGERFDYERDMEPWLGERAAVWGSDGRIVVLLAATDADDARDSLAARGGHERSYRDSDYLVDDAGMAVGIVGDFAAIGPEPAYKQSVDAAEGASLAEEDGYSDAVDELPEDRLAHFWADTPALLDAALEADTRVGELRSLLPAGELPPVAGAFSADGERLAVEARADIDVSGTPLVAELPGDAWFAAGVADAGESARDALDRFAGPLGGTAISAWLRRELGLDLDRDLLDWMGDAAVFVSGTPPTMDGGLVIQPSDEDRAADAFGRIVGAVQQQRGVAARPLEIAGADQAFAIEDRRPYVRPIVLARGSGLVVATSGASAAEAALGSGDRLGDTERYAEAQDLVAAEPTLLVSTRELLRLGTFDHGYLDAFAMIAAGSEDGTVRLAAGLR